MVSVVGGAARRFRSSAVAVPTLTVLAAGVLASCHLPGSHRRVCVDPRQNVIDSRQCSQPGGIGRYYYYNGGHGFGVGSHVSGGSFTSGSHSGGSASAARVGRGGFGGHAAGG
jgi:hypothetical protein